MKKALFALLTLCAALISLGASVWEGAAGVSAGGELPDGGYYAATRSFPRNTLVDVTNLETGKTVRVVVAAGLETPGILAILSREAADAIGLKGESIGRVRISMPVDPASYGRLTEGRTSGGDPDFDPQAAVNAAQAWSLPAQNAGEQPEAVEAAAPEPEALPAAAVAGPEIPPEETAQVAVIEPMPEVLVPENVPEAAALELDAIAQAAEPTLEPELPAIAQAIQPTRKPPAPEPLLPEGDFTVILEPAEQQPPTQAAVVKTLPEGAEIPPIPPEAQNTRRPPLTAIPESAIIPAIPEAPPARRDTAREIDNELLIPPIPPAPQAPVRQAAQVTEENMVPPIPPAPPVARASDRAVQAPPRNAEIDPIPPTPPAARMSDRAVQAPPRNAEIDPIPPASPAVPERTRAAVATTAIPPEVSAPPADTAMGYAAPERGKLYIQLGAFSKGDAAEQELSRIDRIYPLAVEAGLSAGKPLYRALLGPINPGETGALLQKFKREGYHDAFIRRIP